MNDSVKLSQPVRRMEFGPRMSGANNDGGRLPANAEAATELRYNLKMALGLRKFQKQLAPYPFDCSSIRSLCLQEHSTTPGSPYACNNLFQQGGGLERPTAGSECK